MIEAAGWREVGDLTWIGTTDGTVSRGRREEPWSPFLIATVLLTSQAIAEPGRVKTGTLVKEGRAQGCIVIPEGTQKGRVLTAVEDLAAYVQQMSGARVPVCRDVDPCPGFRVLIGTTRLARVRPADVSEKRVGFDGFIIRSVPDGVVVAGGRPQGTANGIYHFAEEVLGVHWFSVEGDGPTYPTRRTIEVPKLNWAVRPDFAMRWQYYSFQQVAEGYRDWTAPLARKVQDNRDGWWRFNRLWGIEAEIGHAFSAIVPDSLHDTHPEYFPFLNYTFEADPMAPFNRRVLKPGPDGSLPYWPWKAGRYKADASIQRCLSNPEVLRLAIEWTAKQFDSNPNLRFAALSANDGPWWCACDRCKALGPTPSHQNLAFANAVAEANEKKYPDRGYVMLAYMYTLEPPVGMKAHHNVVPMIAPLWQCRIHPLSSQCPDCIYVRRAFRSWLKIAGRTAFYHYTTPGPFTFPGPIALAEELRFMRDCGSIGGLRENQFAPAVNWAMLNWMESKLLWDVDQDPVKLRREFLEGHYGRAAAGAIEKVYVRIESRLRSGANYGKSRGDDGSGLHSLTGQELLERTIPDCRDDIDAALKAAQSETEVFRHRVTRDMEALLGDGPAEF